LGEAASGTTTGGFTQYTATFTPSVSSSGTATIGVASSKFTDAASNLNKDTYISGVSGATQEANNQVVLNFDTTGTRDTVAPTIAITSDKTALTSGDTATITFTLSENSTDFTNADIGVSGGTLSNFQGSGKVYTATFTPNLNSTANGIVSVASSKFSDAAGNINADGSETNNTVTMSTNTIDKVPPTIAITSDKTSLIAGETATITFTLSEESADFVATDVTVNGGAIGALTRSSSDPKVYTATFTPTAGVIANSVISVASNKFSDAAGNYNVDGSETNNSISLPTNTIPGDTTPPTIAISRNGTGTLTSSETITFTLSEASDDFSIGDIDVNGGTLSNFSPVPTTGTAGTGYTQYTATFTPSSGTKGNATIGVASAKFADPAGNNNQDTYVANVSGTTQEANNQVSIAFDTSGNPTADTTTPTIIVARAGTGTLATGNTETILFTLSEASTDFIASDIDVTGGTLSAFAPVATSGNATTGYAQYTAVFTPTANNTGTATIGVASSKFADAAGNLNKDTYLTAALGNTQEANNQVSIAFDTTKADTTPPTVAVSRTGTGILSSSETIYFTLSEASTNFDITDIDVSGGTLTAFAPVATTGTSTSGFTQYTATFTPTTGTTGTALIGIASSKFADAAGNLNKDTYISAVAGTTQETNNMVAIGFDTTGTTTDISAPTIAITSDMSTLQAGQTATITFTLSEASADFSLGDIDVTGGTLSNLQGSGKVYTATFAPPVNTTTNSTITVGSLKFRDAAGNFNVDGDEANNTVTIATNTIDKTPPTIAIASDKTSLVEGDTANITFTLSEASTDFTQADIAVSGGTLSNLQGSGTSYTAVFTPAKGSTANGLISVASNKFSDASGNFNTDGAEANNSVSLTVDTRDVTPPTIVVTSDTTKLLAGQTANITFTLSEASKDFVQSDVSPRGGTLSGFAPVASSGNATDGFKQYTAILTPQANSVADTAV
jgi:hypothetical protein